VLYLLFSSTCVACEQNAHQWKTLESRIDSAVMVTVVSLEGPEVAEQWLHRHGLEADRILLPSQPAAFATGWHAQAVPLTILADSMGQVSFAHLGVLAGGDLKQLSDMTRRRHAVSMAP